MKNIFMKLFVSFILMSFVGYATNAFADDTKTTNAKDSKAKVVSSKDTKTCSKECMAKCQKDGKDCSKDCKTKCMKECKTNGKVKASKIKATKGTKAIKAKNAPSEVK